MQKTTWLDALKKRILASNRRRKARRPVSVQLERVEDRTLLSVTSFLVGGKLVVRSSGADDAIVLRPPRDMSLESALEYIESDEYVEVTPNIIRLRKIHLTENDRKRSSRKK